MTNITAPLNPLFGILTIDVRRIAPGRVTAMLTSGNEDPNLFNNTSYQDVTEDQPPPLCDGCPPPIGIPSPLPLDVPLPDTGASSGPIGLAALTITLFGVGLATISGRRSTS